MDAGRHRHGPAIAGSLRQASQLEFWPFGPVFGPCPSVQASPCESRRRVLPLLEARCLEPGSLNDPAVAQFWGGVGNKGLAEIATVS